MSNTEAAIEFANALFTSDLSPMALYLVPGRSSGNAAWLAARDIISAAETVLVSAGTVDDLKVVRELLRLLRRQGSLSISCTLAGYRPQAWKTLNSRAFAADQAARRGIAVATGQAAA
jgi:hypothetical protein